MDQLPFLFFILSQDQHGSAEGAREQAQTDRGDEYQHFLTEVESIWVLIDDRLDDLFTLNRSVLLINLSFFHLLGLIFQPGLLLVSELLVYLIFNS